MGEYYFYDDVITQTTIQLYNVMEARCRLCAECSNDLVSVLEEIQLPEKISQLFQVKIVIDDRLPTVVCRCCCETVQRTWEFSERVQKAQELLVIEENARSKLEFAETEVSQHYKSESNDMVECFQYNSAVEQPKRKTKVDKGKVS